MAPDDVSKMYGAYYFAHSCGRPYSRDAEWLGFFGSIADRIVSDIQPGSVLDAGCAWGFLVELLRERGVEAYGLDISDYAIQKVHPDIKPYCWVGSVADSFPQKYDLIVCIEVLEHVPAGEVERAVENLCCHTEDVLFSSSPYDYKEATHLNVQPPEYWAQLFARNGFLRDVNFDAAFITPWAVRFRKVHVPMHRVVAHYERRMWLLEQENKARREFGVEQRDELVAKEREIQNLSAQVSTQDETIQELSEREARHQKILSSRTGRLILTIHHVYRRFLPESGRPARVMAAASRGLSLWRREGFTAFGLRLGEKVTRRVQIALLRLRRREVLQERLFYVEPVQASAESSPHQASVDIIVCVYNALEDVRRCLESVVRYTTEPYNLILVDDGSDSPTREYLEKFAKFQGSTLLRNEQAGGYTRAANKGLRSSSSDYALLLNSDTIVTQGWLDRMVTCAASNPKIGIVGPLSNTASWQSVPEMLDENGDWATNQLPPGVTIAEMGKRVAQYSARQYPRVSFLNGFCLMIRRQLLDDIGYFDEDTFGEGYGEENDYSLRAQKAGWELAVADDVYVFHAQSKSYSHDRREQLGKRADQALAEKHGQSKISDGVHATRNNRVMVGTRARISVMNEREELIEAGRRRWEGKRIAFALPMTEPGGGTNVILQEAEAMMKMGVDVRLINSNGNRPHFERGYPDLHIPTFYVGGPQQAAQMIASYDAAVATIFHSLDWIQSASESTAMPVRGYYIQDFEPAFFPVGSAHYQEAMESYQRFPDLVRLTKTEWNRKRVKEQVGVDSVVVGASINIDLFRPRRRRDPEWPKRPLRIAAMIRPSTPRRQPGLTMNVLKGLSQRHGGSVEFILFGCHPDDPDFFELETDFPWRHAGLLSPWQLAALLNEVDIFVDFSSFQAMGLTALEAMASGAAVIVPREGGSGTFAKHEANALVIDTYSYENCFSALDRLIQDERLRTHLQHQGIWDVCRFYPERAASNFLQALFPDGGVGTEV